jgi:hypothetical protein
MKPALTFTLHDLVTACAQPGCPVCRLVDRAVLHSLEVLFNENVNDVDLRAELRRSHGYCHAHAWQVLDSGVGDPLGVTILYHDILGNILKDLPTPAAPSRPGEKRLARLMAPPRRLAQLARGKLGDLAQQLRAALRPQVACPACRQQAAATDLVLKVLLAGLADERLAAALQQSSGLCLLHLAQAGERSADPQTLAILLADSRAKLAALHGELGEFIRKYDYRFRGEGFGPERDAWQRAVAKAVGEKPSAAPSKKRV